MAIIPAEPELAFWQLAKWLSDLLCWATHPDPEPLNNGWLAAHKERIGSAADAAIRSVEHLDDESLVKKIKSARRLGFEFATLLCDNPSLSTVRIQDWTVPRFRQLFDDLSELECEFRRLGDEEQTVAEQRAAFARRKAVAAESGEETIADVVIRIARESKGAGLSLGLSHSAGNDSRNQMALELAQSRSRLKALTAKVLADEQARPSLKIQESLPMTDGLDAAALGLLRSSLAELKLRFSSATTPDAPSKVWLVHVHSKGDESLAIYSDGMMDGNNSTSVNRTPSDPSHLGLAAFGGSVSPFSRTVRLRGYQCLKPIGDDAGQLLKGLPATVQTRLWRDLPTGTELGKGMFLWTLAVFEMANAKVVGSPLRAERVRPLTKAEAETVVAAGGKLPTNAEKWASDWPATLPGDGDWYATLPDFAAASVQAIGILQSWLGDELKREAEAASEPPKPVERQAETLAGGDHAGGGQGEAVGKPANLRPCDDKAWSQYRRTIEDNPELTTDQAAYDWFIEHVADEGERLPAFASWVKYVRLARAVAGEQKNKRGVGHETRSVVSAKRLD